MRSYILALCLLLVAGCGLKNYKREISYIELGNVAVIPADRACYSATMADIVTDELLKMNYDIIEREYLTQIFKEHELSLAGILEMKYADTSKIKNVQTIIVTEAEGTNRYIRTAKARIFDLETGKVIASVVFHREKTYWGDTEVPIQKTISAMLKARLELR